MMIACPNKNLPEWKALVDKVGDSQAMYEYYRNDYEIPDVASIEKIDMDIPIQFEREPYYYNSSSEDRLKETVNRFLTSIGVQVSHVERIINQSGVEVDANAMSSLLYKTIQVVEGKAKIDTLPEEAAHFFVALIGKENPLYKSMFNDVINYPIYKEVIRDYGTLYGGDEVKLKEEAMAKIIAQSLVNQFTDEKLERRATSWWSRVIEYLKGIFATGNREELEEAIMDNNYFSEAANMIINNRIKGYDYSLEETGEFYQLSNQEPDTIETALKNNLGRGNVILNPVTEKYELHRPDGTVLEIKNRVSDRVKAASTRKGYTERSEVEKEADKIRAKFGTLGHEDISNIVNREVARLNGTIAPPRRPNLSDSMYTSLEKYIQGFLETFPKGSRFLSEITIYDAGANEAGTLDLVVILPDGKVDYYDWKFQDLKGKSENKKIPYWKKENWNIQLGRYGEVLKREYGIKEIGKRRVIPIEAVYDGNTLKSLTLGPTTIEGFNEKNEYLKPVPIFAEMTGDERLDKLIEDLLKQKENLVAKKATDISDESKRQAFLENKRTKLIEIDKAIQNIQLTHDISEYVKFGTNQIKDIQDVGVTNLSDAELNDNYKTLGFYSQRLINILGELVRDETKAYQSDLSRLVSNAQYYEGILQKEIRNRARNNYGEGIDVPQHSSGIWSRMFRTVSQQTHPIIQSFWKLVQNSKEKTRKDLDSIQSKISSSLEGLRKFQSARGIPNDKLFDFMVRETKGGLKTIAKYSSSFYEEQTRQRQLLKNGSKDEKASALEWFRKNTVFDKERFSKAYAETKKYHERTFKNYDEPSKAVAKAMKDFENRYANNEFGYLNERNFYVKPKDEFFSDEYKYIQDNQPLKEFYDLWINTTTEIQRIIGKPIDTRFVWNVEKDFVDSLVENGIGAIGDLNFLDDLQAKQGLRMGNVDPQTGEPIYKIPTYYTEVITKRNKDGEIVVDTEKQSKDLGRVLYLATAMGYNYKHMAEIEESTKALEIILRNNEELQTNNNGEEIVNPVTDRVQKIVGSSNTVEQFKDYMNYYLYGIRTKTKDYTIEVGDKRISSIALWNTISKYFVSKSLAFNPISIVANAVGGNWNAVILGATGRWYSNSDFHKSLGNIASRNEKAMSVSGFFDLVEGDNVYRKANDLSISALTKYATYENLFIGQLAGDKLIRNSVLLSMLRSHELVDGKISKIKNGKKGGTRLYDLFQVQEGKLKVDESLSDVEVEKFRNKVIQITNNILGTSPNDDIRGVQLSVMGRALMMFRSWIPRTIDSRYGELRYNAEMDEHELGRYRSFWNQLVSKKFVPLLMETAANFGTFGYAKFGNATIERAKELYREALVKNPRLEMTEEQYIELHISNLRANMMEIYLVGSFLGMLMVARGDDEDQEEAGAFRKYIVRQMDRNLSELLFYYNPTEFNRILKSPIPITRMLTDMVSLVTHGTGEVVGTALDNEEMEKENRPTKYVLKLFPILNSFEQLLTIVDEDYDREKQATFSSKSR